MDRVIGWCLGILLATIALYCAVSLLESIMPTLIVIIGVVALIGLTICVVVVINTWRNRW